VSSSLKKLHGFRYEHPLPISFPIISNMANIPRRERSRFSKDSFTVPGGLPLMYSSKIADNRKKMELRAGDSQSQKLQRDDSMATSNIKQILTSV
jgi:hypothetical protein